MSPTLSSRTAAHWIDGWVGPEEQARRQIEVNLFGALWVSQAAIPILREQGSGWIVQVFSIGGLAAFPLIGISTVTTHRSVCSSETSHTTWPSIATSRA